MGVSAWLNLKGSDFAALFIAGLLGYLAGSLAPHGFWSILIYLLVSYHLFLAWLVLTGERDAAVSLPFVHTAFTHIACLTIVLPLGLARYYLPLLILRSHPTAETLTWVAIISFFTPFFRILRYAVIGFAVFERYWLFSGDEVKKVVKPIEAAPSPILQAATADDAGAWQEHLAQQKPESRRPGSSLKAEYEQWLHARQQSRQSEVTVPGSQL